MGYSFVNRKEMIDWLRANLTDDEIYFIGARKPFRNPAPFGHSRKSVFVFDLDGNKVCEYESILVAEKETGVARANIRYCIRNSVKAKNNIVFSYRDEFPSCKKKGVGNKKYKGQNDKPVFVFDIEGSFVGEYKSGKEAAKKMGMTYRQITGAIQRGSFSGGFYFSRKRDFTLPVVKKYNRNPILRPGM